MSGRVALVLVVLILVLGVCLFRVASCTEHGHKYPRKERGEVYVPVPTAPVPEAPDAPEVDDD